MISDLLKHRRGTSPHMLAISAGLHLIAIALLIISAKNFVVAPMISDHEVTNVRLVESRPITSSAMQQLPNQSLDMSPQVPSIEPAQLAKQSPREIEQLKTVLAKVDPSGPVIQMKKRKQGTEKIEIRKQPRETKSKVDKPKKEQEKKLNSNEFLEKRLAAIKKDMALRNSEKSKNMGRSGLDTPAGAGSGSQTNAEIARWFEAVRNRINSHWSVLGEESKAPAKATIISVQLSDDGRLLEASIDSGSGDTFFDSSAMRAIYQSAPFPPMSPEISAKIRAEGGLALRFTPGGLQ